MHHICCYVWDEIRSGTLTVTARSLKRYVNKHACCSVSLSVWACASLCLSLSLLCACARSVSVSVTTVPAQSETQPMPSRWIKGLWQSGRWRKRRPVPMAWRSTQHPSGPLAQQSPPSSEASCDLKNASQSSLLPS